MPHKTKPKPILLQEIKMMVLYCKRVRFEGMTTDHDDQE